MNPKKPRLTISLLTYNSAKYIPYLAASLRAQTWKDFEIIVWDNNSSDDTLKIIKEEGIEGKILAQRYNAGFSKAHNSIINWSDSEYVLVLNPDVVLDPNYLKHLIEFLDEHQEIGSIAGLMYRWDFANETMTTVIDSAGLIADHRYHFADRYQGQEIEVESGPVFGLSGTATIYRRQALEATKVPKRNNKELFEYFDEDFFLYKEDIDLAWRLRLNGWENYCLTSAVVHHDRSISQTNSRWQRRQGRKLINLLSYRNHLMTIKKNAFTSITLKHLWSIWWYEVAKAGYLVLLDFSSPRGLWSYLALRPKMVYKRKYIKKLICVKAKDMEQWFIKTQN
jgi:GT2 family glycosyltransferase